jgi:hypothetical protein
MAQNLLRNKQVEAGQGLALRFSQNFSSQKYQLFEVPSETQLQAILSGDQALVIKGNPSLSTAASAVLCCESRSFKLKKVENTNKVYIVD